MFSQPALDEWKETLETDLELEASNKAAAKPEAASAEVFKDAVKTVGEKSEKCHELMESRVIFADEANFVFNGHTRLERMTKIDEIDKKISQLKSMLGESEEGREEIEKQIRSEELNKIELVLEQSYADITYLMTRRKTVAKLSEEMVEAAKEGNLSKEQISNLLTEANELQKIYISMGVSSAEAKQLIQYFRLEFKSDAVPILAKLTAEAEIYSDMEVNIDDADKMDFEATFNFWLDQLVQFDLNDEIAQLTEFQTNQSDDQTLSIEQNVSSPVGSAAAVDSGMVLPAELLSDQTLTEETDPNQDSQSGSITAEQNIDSQQEPPEALEVKQKPTRNQVIRLKMIQVLTGVIRPNLDQNEKVPASGINQSSAALPLAV